MLHEKEHYQKLNFSVFKWDGFWNGLHHFSTQTERGFDCISCTEEMLTNGDMEYMVEHGLTFNPKSNLLK